MSCFSSTDGKFGEMVPEVLNPITLGSIFTLNFKNWISYPNGTFTFLTAPAPAPFYPNALNTTEYVKLSTKPLDTTFQFMFQKMGCPITSGTINYGDRVQLVSYAMRVAQCAWGTCSTVDPGDSGGCDPTKWQTFTVRSAIGKTGPVCFGDEIRITQTVGTNCSITAASASGVQCWDGDYKNSSFYIFPVGGSLYVDPADYVADYETRQDGARCKLNPWDLSCIWSAITNFFHEIWIGVLIVVGIIVLILIIIVIYYVQQIIKGL